ncbi:hypothetical protein BJ741DRAFT_668138 [Chytriomyces cf. hyalinus JEL632]|nr:hypothetical protein BJ741DRAFT_671436 [Chytriomyces cf. hyalinus JEL632]KAI8831083.1 hypothetical protein BJ741DRAFT_668138 [Chytriomyces cf. hyalinus JEL632]
MTHETVEHGSTQKRNKNESVDAFLRRVTHVSLVGRGIAAMQALDACRNLTVLYCTKTTLLGLKGYRHAQLSHLAGNKISHVSGLHQLPALECLHLDGQRITEPLTFDEDCMNYVGNSLCTLTVSGCNIEELNTLAGLTYLEELDLFRNNISNWEASVANNLSSHLLMLLLNQGLQYFLGSCTQLRSLNVNANPVAGIVKFRQKAILAGQCLETLNEKDIPSVEREFLFNMHSAKQKAKSLKTKGTHKLPSPAEPKGPHIFALTMLGNPEHNKPVPHLPPYASQYRDLILHQIATSSNASKLDVMATSQPMLGAVKDALNRGRVARAAELETPSQFKVRLPMLPPNQQEQHLSHEYAGDWGANNSSAGSVFGSTVAGFGKEA